MCFYYRFLSNIIAVCNINTVKNEMSSNQHREQPISSIYTKENQNI